MFYPDGVSLWVNMITLLSGTNKKVVDHKRTFGGGCASRKCLVSAVTAWNYPGHTLLHTAAGPTTPPGRPVQTSYWSSLRTRMPRRSSRLYRPRKQKLHVRQNTHISFTLCEFFLTYKQSLLFTKHTIRWSVTAWVCVGWCERTHGTCMFHLKRLQIPSTLNLILQYSTFFHLNTWTDIRIKQIHKSYESKNFIDTQTIQKCGPPPSNMHSVLTHQSPNMHAACAV